MRIGNITPEERDGVARTTECKSPDSIGSFNMSEVPAKKKAGMGHEYFSKSAQYHFRVLSRLKAPRVDEFALEEQKTRKGNVWRRMSSEVRLQSLFRAADPSLRFPNFGIYN